MYQNSTIKKNIFLLLLKGIKKMSIQYNTYLFLYRKSIKPNNRQLLFRLLESKSKFILLIFEMFQEYYSLIHLWNIEQYFIRLKKEIMQNLTGIRRMEYNLEINVIELENLNLSFIKNMLRKVSELSFRNILLRHQFELKSVLSDF
ncbi:MAG: hypothetical protein CMP12_03030 [Zunongwangia sp.]|jgi:hypothetical protein|nr:hypothetical protein [Flavobacteriaceae bacterium]MAO34879.1 hypothetical protein [Zunongwangia sp.]MAS70046.1 hypothetical protein [Zunongwangia sp.]HCV79447.1 hypothetical protein [Zunongwangia profunda]